MISPEVYRLPGWWRWNRYFAVITDDFGSPQATAVGRTQQHAWDRCVADFEHQEN